MLYDIPKYIKLMRNCMQLIINLILLSKCDIWRWSDFSISRRSLFFFLLFIFLLVFLLSCHCGNIHRMSHTAFFEFFPCDVELWSAVNAGLEIWSLQSWRWIKANKKDIPDRNSTFTINEALVNMILFYSVSKKKCYQERKIKKYLIVIKVTK